MIDTGPPETRQPPSKNASRLSDDPDDGEEGMELVRRQLQPPAPSLRAECVCPQRSWQPPALLTERRRKAETPDHLLQPLWPLASLGAAGTQHLAKRAQEQGGQQMTA